jgi:two-component system response regulator GlrR
MVFSLPDIVRENSMANGASSTIQIMRDTFLPEEQRNVIACLEANGSKCVLFDGFERLADLLWDRDTKLLLVGASAETFPRLLEVINSTGGKHSRNPVLVYYKDRITAMKHELLAPEIDDFDIEPLNLESLKLRVNHLLRRSAEQQYEVHESQLSLISHFGMKQFIGMAPAFVAAIKKIPRIAVSEAPVLINGETGTGKEMCARAVHYLSTRNSHPFIPINCGAIPVELFENEMFGHEYGAFTGAGRARHGLIAEAEGGTLFLDEIDSLTLASQAKLLRFLQTCEYRPLGSTKYRQASVRLLAASNQNLLGKVKEKAFREDLFYRLMVISINLPPLRDREEDIMALAHHFLKVATQEYKSPARRFSREAELKLTGYKWPGNVRELENVIRNAVLLADTAVICARNIQLASDVPLPEISLDESFQAAKARVIKGFERNYLQQVLETCGGNISKAARQCKKNRRAFFALLKKHGITHVGQSPSSQLLEESGFTNV